MLDVHKRSMLLMWIHSSKVPLYARVSIMHRIPSVVSVLYVYGGTLHKENKGSLHASDFFIEIPFFALYRNSFRNDTSAASIKKKKFPRSSKPSIYTLSIPAASLYDWPAICSFSILILSSLNGAIDGFESNGFFVGNYSFTPQMGLNGFSWHFIDPWGVNWSFSAFRIQIWRGSVGIASPFATAGLNAQLLSQNRFNQQNTLLSTFCFPCICPENDSHVMSKERSDFGCIRPPLKVRQ